MGTSLEHTSDPHVSIMKIWREIREHPGCDHAFVTWSDTKEALRVIMGDEKIAKDLIDRKAKLIFDGQCPPGGSSFNRIVGDEISSAIHKLENCQMDSTDDEYFVAQFLLGKDWAEVHSLRMAVHAANGGCPQAPRAVNLSAAELRTDLMKDQIHPFLSLVNYQSLVQLLGSASDADAALAAEACRLHDSLATALLTSACTCPTSSPKGGCLGAVKPLVEDLKEKAQASPAAFHTADHRPVLIFAFGEAKAEELIKLETVREKSLQAAPTIRDFEELKARYGEEKALSRLKKRAEKLQELYDCEGADGCYGYAAELAPRLRAEWKLGLKTIDRQYMVLLAFVYGNDEALRMTQKYFYA